MLRTSIPPQVSCIDGEGRNSNPSSGAVIQGGDEWVLVPTHHPAAAAPSPALTLCHEPSCIVGRRGEVAAVLAGLRGDTAVVVWGGSGEGKTTVAHEAARRMQEAGSLVLSAALNMHGALLLHCSAGDCA